jgi:hypothetical protein
MIHKLALITSLCSEKELLEKLAISMKEDNRIQQQLIDKSRALGAEVPMVKRREMNPETGKIVEETLPDIGAMDRKRSPVGLKEKPLQGELLSMQEKLKTMENAPGTHPADVEYLKQKIHMAETAPTRMPNPAAVKEIHKAHGIVSNSIPARLRQHYVAPVKRFWSGMNTLGTQWNPSPWKNRLLVGLPAAGLAGLGIKGYLDSRRTPQPEKFSAYVNDIASVPRPAPIPRLTAPGPFSKSLPMAEPVGKNENSNVNAPKSQQTKTSDDNNSMLPILGAGAGGLAGHLVGSKIIAPLAEAKEKSLASEMASLQSKLDNWRRVREYGPATVTVAGAILLAALAARKARENERERQGIPSRSLQQFNSSGGFRPEDQVEVGSGRAFY